LIGGAIVAEGKRSRIPEFLSREEEAAFWDEHDLGEFEDELEPVEMGVVPPLGHILLVRLGREDFRRLSAEARDRGTNVVTLAEALVLESLDRAEAAEPAADRGPSTA
jgi:hypothetical protein